MRLDSSADGGKAGAAQGHHDLAADGRPSHRVDHHRGIAEWLERWVNEPTTEPTTEPLTTR